MFHNPPSQIQQTAESVTVAIMQDLEESIEGDPRKAVIYCNSAMAACVMIFEKHGITKQDYQPVFDQVWSKIIDRN